MMKKQITLNREDAATILVGTRNILYINEAISWLITDLLNEVKKSDLYHHKVKMLCKRVSKEMHLTNLKICETLKQTLEMMQDESDEFQKLIIPHQQILFYSTRNALLKAIPQMDKYASILSYIALISKAIDISRENLYDWFKCFNVKHYPINIKSLAYMDNTNALNSFRKLYEEILRIINISPDATMEGGNITDAKKIYDYQLKDIGNTMKAIKAAGHSKFNFEGIDVCRPKHYELPERLR